MAAFHIAFPINSVASLVADKALLQKTNMVQTICISTSVSSANNSTICRIALASLLNKKEQELYRNLFLSILDPVIFIERFAVELRLAAFDV